MHSTSPLIRLIFFLVLLLAGALSAHAQLSSWEKGGGTHGRILSVMYTPNHKNLLAIVDDWWQGILLLQYNIATARTDTLQIWYHSPFYAPVFSHDGSALCFRKGPNSDSLVVWSLYEKKARCSFYIANAAHQSLLHTAFSSDSKEVALITTTPRDTVVQRRNAYNGVLQHSFPLVPAYDPIGLPHFSHDGETVVLPTREWRNQQYVYYIEFWRTRTGEHIVHPLQHSLRLLTVTGQFFAYYPGYQRDTILLRDIFSNAVVATIAQPLESLKLIDGGKYIAGYAYTHKEFPQYTASLIDVQKQAVIHSTPIFSTAFGSTPHIEHLVYAHDNSSFAAVQTTSSYCNDMPKQMVHIGIYNTDDGSCLYTFPEGHFGLVNDIEASPDGIYAASTGKDWQTLLWDVTTATVVGRNPGTGVLAFSNDATTLFRASAIDSSLVALAIPSMEMQQHIPLTPRIPTILRTAPTNVHLLCASTNLLAVYKQQPLHREYTIPVDTATYTIADAGFSSTGDSIVVILLPTQHDTTMLITTWQASSGKQISSVTLVDTAGFRPTVLLSPNTTHITTLTTIASVRTTSNGTVLRTLPAMPTIYTTKGDYLLYDKVVFHRTHQTPALLAHLFCAFSVDTPANDFSFDVAMGNREVVSSLTVLPSGKQVLYTAKTSCRSGTLFYAHLESSHSRLYAGRTIDLGMIKAGETTTGKSALQAWLPMYQTIRSIHLSDSSVLDFCTIAYNRMLPDTIDENTLWSERFVSVSCAPIYNHPVDFTITVYYTGHSYTDSLTIHVVGTVLPPEISTTKRAVDFGTIPVGTRVSDSLTIANSTQASLYISSIAIDDPDNSHRAAYSLPAALPLWLPPGGTQPITVSYLPNSEDSLRAFLVLHTNDANTPTLRIPLTGKGLRTVGVPPSTLSPLAMSIAPNPTHSLLHVRFALRSTGIVRIQLFSSQGKLVRTWNTDQLGEGTYTLPFAVEGITSGVYYCVLTTPAGTQAQPVVIAPQ